MQTEQQDLLESYAREAQARLLPYMDVCNPRCGPLLQARALRRLGGILILDKTGTILTLFQRRLTLV